MKILNSNDNIRLRSISCSILDLRNLQVDIASADYFHLLATNPRAIARDICGVKIKKEDIPAQARENAS